MPAPQSRPRFSRDGDADDEDVDGDGDEGEGNSRCILARKLAEPFRSAREIWGYPPSMPEIVGGVEVQ